MSAIEQAQTHRRRRRAPSQSQPTSPDPRAIDQVLAQLDQLVRSANERTERALASLKAINKRIREQHPELVAAEEEFGEAMRASNEVGLSWRGLWMQLPHGMRDAAADRLDEAGARKAVRAILEEQS